jgi:hypothetical protein
MLHNFFFVLLICWHGNTFVLQLHEFLFSYFSRRLGSNLEPSTLTSRSSGFIILVLKRPVFDPKIATRILIKNNVCQYNDSESREGYI